MKPDDPIFPPRAAAEYLQTTTGTLAWWRHVGRGPGYVKREGRIFYRQSVLDAFLEKGVVEPEAA